MITLKFLGTGSAFDTSGLGQTNAILHADDDGCLLIDCGTDCRHALKTQGYSLADIDGVYVSHLHADHVGGLEWMALSTYFNPNYTGRPKLFANHKVMHDLWDKTLRGGLESVQKKVCNLTDYFDTQPVYPNGCFWWKGAKFTPVQTVHIMNGMEIVYSYGLVIDACPDMNPMERIEARKAGHTTRIFYTADTQFAPAQLVDFYTDADLIFHDCETTPFRSNVHAHLGDLEGLPSSVKEKMWLMHYQFIKGENMNEVAEAHGFAGFVQDGFTHRFELGVSK